MENSEMSGSSTYKTIGIFFNLGLISNWGNISIKNSTIQNYLEGGIVLNSHQFNNVTISNS
jgi:hypothetical protein